MAFEPIGGNNKKEENNENRKMSFSTIIKIILLNIGVIFILYLQWNYTNSIKEEQKNKGTGKINTGNVEVNTSTGNTTGSGGIIDGKEYNNKKKEENFDIVSFFNNQNINWELCFGNEKYNHWFFKDENIPDDLFCAEIKVPLSYDKYNAKEETDYGTLALTMNKHNKKGEFKGNLYLIPGGPGGNGINFLNRYFKKEEAKKMLNNFNVISYAGRGIYPSKPILNCGNYYIAEDSIFFEACKSRTNKELYENLSSIDNVEDLKLIISTTSQNNEPTNLFAFSYGNKVIGLFAKKYPENIRSIVFDSTTKIDENIFNFYEETQKLYQKGIEDLISYCKKNIGKCPFIDFEGYKNVLEQINSFKLKDKHINTIGKYQVLNMMLNYLGKGEEKYEELFYILRDLYSKNTEAYNSIYLEDILNKYRYKNNLLLKNASPEKISIGDFFNQIGNDTSYFETHMTYLTNCMDNKHLKNNLTKQEEDEYFKEFKKIDEKYDFDNFSGLTETSIKNDFYENICYNLNIPSKYLKIKALLEEEVETKNNLNILFIGSKNDYLTEVLKNKEQIINILGKTTKNHILEAFFDKPIHSASFSIDSCLNQEILDFLQNPNKKEIKQECLKF